MKIVVLVKHVPVLAAVCLDPATRRLQREGVPSQVSSFDVRALVRAVDLRDGLGGEVVVLTVGPPAARSALLHCLALGADRAIHLVDSAFAGGDTLATARALASAVRNEGFDLVLCGRSSIDAGTGQVGPRVAELLGVVQVTGVRRLEIGAGSDRLAAERESEDGYERVETRLPAVVTAAEDLARERFPTEIEIEEANAKSILEMGAAGLGLSSEEVGAAGSATEVVGLETGENTRASHVLEAASVVEQAKQLASELGDRGLLTAQGGRGDLLPPAPDRPRDPRGPGYWVLAEVLRGKVRPVTFELLGKASELAEQCGGHVVGLLIGGPAVGEHVDSIAAHGADVVCVADDVRLDPYTTDSHAAVISDAIRVRQPTAVLIASTVLGRDLAPRVAARLGLGLVGGCIDLAATDDGRLVCFEPALGGDVIARVLSRTRPAMATVLPGMLAARELNWARRTRWERLAVGSLGPKRLSVIERSRGEASDAAALDVARVIVGVGKGIGGPENLDVVRELAAALGAPVAATRGVADRGWLPRQYQVGLTGRAIAPLLYIAVAIRGTPEHVAGIRRAGFVVAINNDPKAPIFEHADRCQVADYAAAVPALAAAVKRRLGTNAG